MLLLLMILVLLLLSGCACRHSSANSPPESDGESGRSTSGLDGIFAEISTATVQGRGGARPSSRQT